MSYSSTLQCTHLKYINILKSTRTYLVLLSIFRLRLHKNIYKVVKYKHLFYVYKKGCHIEGYLKEINSFWELRSKLVLLANVHFAFFVNISKIYLLKKSYHKLQDESTKECKNNLGQALQKVGNPFSEASFKHL